MTMSIEHAERVQVKIFASETADPMALIPVFHRWIQDSVLEDELAIDVADYSHVHEGPGVVLIGHGADYYYDLGEGKPGLMYSRKRALEGTLGDRLRDAIKNALSACERLENEGIGLKFDRSSLSVRVPDRLHAPNTDESYAAFETLAAKVIESELGKAPTLTREERRGGPLAARASL